MQKRTSRVQILITGRFLLGYARRAGRTLPYTTREGDCTAEGTSIRTAEGEDACYDERTEPTPTVYPPVWFPPLDFDSGIIKVGVDGELPSSLDSSY